MQEKAPALVSVSELLGELGRQRNPSEETMMEYLKEYGIHVVAEFRRGRGVTRLMTREQYDQILAKHKPKAATPEPEVKDDPQLHIIALEERVARLEARLDGNTQAINTLVKAANILADRLNGVLAQLGVPTQ